MQQDLTNRQRASKSLERRNLPCWKGNEILLVHFQVYIPSVLTFEVTGLYNICYKTNCSLMASLPQQFGLLEFILKFTFF